MFYGTKKTLRVLFCVFLIIDARYRADTLCINEITDKQHFYNSYHHVSYWRHIDSVNKVMYIMDMLRYWIIRYEGGYQEHQEDAGNYSPDGKLIGTKHGISAAFVCRYKPHMCSKYYINKITLEDAVCLVAEYMAERRPICNMDTTFLKVYIMYAMHYGIEVADYFVCQYYGLAPSAENAIKIYTEKGTDEALSKYLVKKMEDMINNYSCVNKPIFCTSWRRRFYEIVEMWRL